MNQHNEQTFANFLKHSIRQMTEKDTLSLVKLLRICRKPNPNRELMAPLVLYAIANGKSGTLRQRILSAKDPDLREMLDMLNYLSYDTENKLKCGDEQVLPEYRDWYNRYLSYLKFTKGKAELKEQMADYVMDYLRESGTSILRLSKETGIDYGNLHKWLTHSKDSHLGTETAKMIFDHVCQRKADKEASA